MFKRVTTLLAILFFTFGGTGQAWHDKTHIAIGEAVGYPASHNFAAPDVVKLRAYCVEECNHYSNNDRDELVTAKTIKDQIKWMDQAFCPTESKGRLYGALMKSLQTCIEKKQKDKNAFIDHDMAFVGHYIGDLVMPLHNIEHKGWAIGHHFANDSILEKDEGKKIDISRIVITNYVFTSKDEIIAKLAELANDSARLGYRMQDDNKDMTEEEAYAQLSKGASFFKAVWAFVEAQGKP
jgi:hypothetical protein